MSFQTKSVSDKKRFGQKAFRTKSVLDKKCFGQKVFQTKSVSDKKHFGQKVFRTIDATPYTSTLTFRVENSALVLSCQLKFVHEMPDLNKTIFTDRQTEVGGIREYTRKIYF